MRKAKVLWLAVEPTDYLRDEFTLYAGHGNHDYRFVFLGAGMTQAWDVDWAECLSEMPGMLPSVSRLLRFLLTEALAPADVVVLEGYAPAHFAVTAAFMSIIGVPWLMRGDTPLRKAEDARTPLKQALLGWIVRHAAKLLPGGTRQAANFAAAGAEEGSIRIAGMTVDEAKFCVARRVQEQGVPRLSLISVGRLIPRKRMSTVLEVVEGCRKRGLDVTAEIVGDGPERDRLCRDPLVREGVVVLRGRLAQAGVAEALCRADAFILLSEDEPWGLVVNEAQAAGLPVIVAEGVGCAPDLVQEGVTGFVVPGADVETVVATVCRLTKDGDLREALGRNGRSLSEKRSLRALCATVESAISDAAL